MLIQQKKGAIYNANYFRVKALVGWNYKKEIKQENEFLPLSLIEEIEDSNLSLYLGLHSHEISIGEDATVILKLKFIAYLEALMDSPTTSNILYTDDQTFDSDNTQAKLQVEATQKAAQQQDRELSSDEEKSIKKIEDDMQQRELTNRAKAYSRILNYIREKGFINYVVTEIGRAHV